MSEVTCNTIKDILPLYVDGVVSDDTRNMVAKHLEHCEECKKKYEANSTSDPSIDFTATNLDEKYAGCPIYQLEGGQTIYLEDYSGFYIPFELTEYIAQQEN